MPHAHINATRTYQCHTHISMPHAHINATRIYQCHTHITLLQSAINPITRYPFYTKNLILRNIISTSISRHTDNTQALHPYIILPVFSSQLDLRFNSTELFKIIARAIMLPQHIAFSPKPSTIMLVVATVFSKNRCSQFIPFVLYIGILKTMDRLRSCAQPQRFFPELSTYRLFVAMVFSNVSLTNHTL